MLRGIVNVFNKFPLFAPIISAGLLSIVGDTIAQHLLEKKSWKHHDFRRSSRLALYGFFIIGPASCLWLRFLDRVVIHHHIGIRTLKRVLVDQLIFSPIFLGIFFVYNHFTENGRIQGVSKRFKSGYLNTLIASYKLWPAIQFFNFYLVPLNYQLLFLNLIAIGWTAFLSNANQLAANDLEGGYQIINDAKEVKVKDIKADKLL